MDYSEGSFCSHCSKRFESVGPESIIKLLGINFFEKAASTEWYKRKEAMELLLNILKTSPRLKDGDYRPLLNHLRKIILTDLCVIVVGLAVQCVTQLARSLGKYFSKYAEGMCRILFEKFVEKRQKMTEQLREAVDTIFETTKFEYFQNTVTRLLSHRNPTVRYEIVLFLARSFPKCNKNVLTKPQFDPLYKGLRKLLNVGDIVIREKTMAALGAAMQMAGKDTIEPYICDIDLASKAKIEVYHNKAWEAAKTYNEMKFPNFYEKQTQLKYLDCPARQMEMTINTSQSNCSFELKNRKRDKNHDSVSENRIAIRRWTTNNENNTCEKAKVTVQQTVNVAQTENIERSVSREQSNVSRERSYVRNVYKMDSMERLTRELSMPAQRSINKTTSLNKIRQPTKVASSKSEELFNRKKSNHNSMQDLNREKGEQIIGQKPIELKNEQEVFCWKEPVCGEPNVLQMSEKELLLTNVISFNELKSNNENVNKCTKTISHVFPSESCDTRVDIENDSSSNQLSDNNCKIYFTKKELNELLKVLNIIKNKSEMKSKKNHKQHNKKRHRKQESKKGVNQYYMSNKCQQTLHASAVKLTCKPTQTSTVKMSNTPAGVDVEPPSVSCILNCCEKCTRLLVATAPVNSKYLIPVHCSTTVPNGKKSTEQVDTSPIAADSSDLSLYKQVVSSNRFQTKSESALKTVKDRRTGSSSEPPFHEMRTSRSLDSSNFYCLTTANQATSCHRSAKSDAPSKCSMHNCGICEFSKDETWKESKKRKSKKDSSSNCEEEKVDASTETIKSNLIPMNQTSDKNTYVTTTGGRKRKRSRSISVQKSADSIQPKIMEQELVAETEEEDLYSLIPFVNNTTTRAGQVRATKVKVIRIE